MKTLRFALYAGALLAGLTLCSCVGGGGEAPLQAIEETLGPVEAWDDLPSALGVSAPFVGESGGMLLLAGGCNFPEVPAAEGGTKVYYDSLYVHPLEGEGGWTSVGSYPLPLAYGASVTTPHGVVCLGGCNEQGSNNQVRLLRWLPQEGYPFCEDLPALPVDLDNFAAAYGGGKIYVAGGNANGQPSNRVFVLDFPEANPQAQMSAWIEIPPFPGPARVQPVLAVQEAADGLRLYLSGGYAPAGEETEAVVSCSLWSFHPGTQSWREEPAVPGPAEGQALTFSGGCCLPYQDSLVLFFCGVNHECFSAALNRNLFIRRAQAAGNKAQVRKLKAQAQAYMHHPDAWYRFNPQLWAYNTYSQSWTLCGSSQALARAGAGAYLHGHKLLILNGELKPGIRTPQVNALHL